MSLMEVYLVIEAKVSLESTLSFWENPLFTNLALYFPTLPLVGCFTLYNHMELIVGDLQLRAVILHKKVQEDPSTPLQKPQEEVRDPGREVGLTGK
jgi:hypothetical protein